MKKLAVLGLLVSTPAFAHPGTAEEHASISFLEHVSISALPAILALVMIGLAVVKYLRRT